MNKGKPPVNDKAKVKNPSPQLKKKSTNVQEAASPQTGGNNSINGPMLGSYGNQMSNGPYNSLSNGQGDYDPHQGTMMMMDSPELKFANFIDNTDGGESVKVALRIRPMSQLELSRGDEYCVKVLNDRSVQLSHK